MKIYKVPKRNNGLSGDEHTGYYYTTSKREATAFFKENGADPAMGDKIQELTLAMNKWDVIRFLNAHCSHPDNG